MFKHNIKSFFKIIIDSSLPVQMFPWKILHDSESCYDNCKRWLMSNLKNAQWSYCQSRLI
jgi:hypothetical protein